MFALLAKCIKLDASSPSEEKENGDDVTNNIIYNSCGQKALLSWTRCESPTVHDGPPDSHLGWTRVVFLTMHCGGGGWSCNSNSNKRPNGGGGHQNTENTWKYAPTLSQTENIQLRGGGGEDINPQIRQPVKHRQLFHSGARDNSRCFCTQPVTLFNLPTIPNRMWIMWTEGCCWRRGSSSPSLFHYIEVPQIPQNKVPLFRFSISPLPLSPCGNMAHTKVTECNSLSEEVRNYGSPLEDSNNCIDAFRCHKNRSSNSRAITFSPQPHSMFDLCPTSCSWQTSRQADRYVLRHFMQI